MKYPPRHRSNTHRSFPEAGRPDPGRVALPDPNNVSASWTSSSLRAVTSSRSLREYTLRNAIDRYSSSPMRSQTLSSRSRRAEDLEVVEDQEDETSRRRLGRSTSVVKLINGLLTDAVSARLRITSSRSRRDAVRYPWTGRCRK